MISRASVIWDLLKPIYDDAALERLINVRIDEATQKRIDELAIKCTEGNLSHEERNEYIAYVDAFDIFASIKMNARRTMKLTK